MSRHYYTADGLAFEGPWEEGQEVKLVDGTVLTGNLRGPVPGIGIYLATEDSTQCTPASYYARNVALSFTGTLGTDTGRVVEAVSCDQIPIDQLLNIKLSELNDHVTFVVNQSVRSTDSVNFWISLIDSERRRRTNTVGFFADRHKDRVLGIDSSLGYNPIPGGPDPLPTSYWARDPRVLLIRDSNGNRIRTPVDEKAWGQVLKDQGLYDEQAGDAEDAVNNDVATAYDAYVTDPTPANWDVLANIDVTDPSYGWPTYYTGAVSLGIRNFP